MKFFLHMFFLSCLAIASIFPANADEIGIPKVLPNMHTAKIADLAVIKNGKELVSASKDGVIHIWDLSNNGKIIRSIYTSKGEHIYAMAVSPDESELIVSGYMTLDDENFYLKVYDLNSGEIKHIVAAHSNIINSLEYSQDGSYVVSSSTDRNLVIWNTKDWSKETLLKGHYSGVDSVKFVNAVPAVVSASKDGEVYYWQLSKEKPKRLLRKKETKDRIQTSIAVSKDNNLIAIGRSGSVHIFDRKGEPEKRIEISNGKVTTVNLSNDGNHLFVATIKPYALLKINIKTGKTEKIHRCKGVSTGCKAIITSVFNSQTRDGFLLGDMEGNIYKWGSGEPEAVGGYLNLAGITKVGFSSKNKLIWRVGKTSDYYGLSLNENSTELTVPDRLEIEPSAWKGSGLHKYNDLRLEINESGSTLNIYKNKEQVGKIEKDSSSGYAHLSYSFLLNGKSIVSGGNDGLLIQYDLEGNIEGEYIGHVGDIQSLAISSDYKYLISGAADNMLKIWNIETKEEVLSIFYDPMKRWVMWIPSGYYTASINGHNIFGWLFDNGIKERVSFVNASQISDKFYQPNIISKTLSSMGVFVPAITKSDVGEFAKIKLLTIPPPEINNPNLKLEVSMINADSIKVFVNKDYVKEAVVKGLIRTFEQTVSLKEGDNEIVIIGYKEGNKDKIELKIKYTGKIKKRKYLYDAINLVAIGANSGEVDGSSKLNYADNDAKAISVFYKSDSQLLLAEDKTNILTIATGTSVVPNKTNIIEGLNIFKNTGDYDINILSLSGHGLNIDNEYYFVPDDFKRDSSRRIEKSSLIKWDDIEKALNSATGTRIIFIDTCYSGSGSKDFVKIINMLKDKSIIVYSATDNKNKALELEHLERGAFSHAVTKSLERNIDGHHYQGDVLAAELLLNISSIVKKVTKGRQTPTTVLIGGEKIVAKGK